MLPQILLAGLVVGSCYAMVSVGMTILIQATTVLNFAHGECVMIGAFVSTRSGAEARERSIAMLKRVGMEKEAKKLGRELTLLQLKRLEIAKALATGPELLLLDEVAAGLTSNEIDEVLELVHQLHDEGITFMVVEHVMKVIVNLSHRIIVIDFGKEIARGTPDEVMSNPAVHAAYLGEEPADE